jgi:hypothetical protein
MVQDQSNTEMEIDIPTVNKSILKKHEGFSETKEATSPSEKKKRVSFFETVYVILIPRFEEFHVAKIADQIWWTGRELHSFKVNCCEELTDFLHSSVQTKDLDRKIGFRLYLQKLGEEIEKCKPMENEKPIEKENTVPTLLIDLKYHPSQRNLVGNTALVKSPEKEAVVPVKEHDCSEQRRPDDITLFLFSSYIW